MGVFKVKGNSMNPCLWPNDFVITFKTKNIRKNDIVVVDLHLYGKIIKRIRKIIGNEVLLVGDNPRIQSSSCNILHPKEKVLGKVIIVLSIRGWHPRYLCKILREFWSTLKCHWSNICSFLGKKICIKDWHFR